MEASASLGQYVLVYLLAVYCAGIAYLLFWIVLGAKVVSIRFEFIIKYLWLGSFISDFDGDRPNIRGVYFVIFPVLPLVVKLNIPRKSPSPTMLRPRI